MEEPLSKSATAHPDSRRGNHSDTALVAPGQLPASPRPSANLNAPKLRIPVASEVAMAATEYHSTARLRPSGAEPIDDAAGDPLSERVRDTKRDHTSAKSECHVYRLQYGSKHAGLSSI